MNWMSLRQFSSIVGRDIQTVRMWARDGKIDTIEVGGVKMVTYAELKRYQLEGHLSEDSKPVVLEEKTIYLDQGE